MGYWSAVDETHKTQVWVTFAFVVYSIQGLFQVVLCGCYTVMHFLCFLPRQATPTWQTTFAKVFLSQLWKTGHFLGSFIDELYY